MLYDKDVRRQGAPLTLAAGILILLEMNLYHIRPAPECTAR